jgi:hypothetical protein
LFSVVDSISSSHAGAHFTNKTPHFASTTAHTRPTPSLALPWRKARLIFPDLPTLFHAKQSCFPLHPQDSTSPGKSTKPPAVPRLVLTCHSHQHG